MSEHAPSVPEIAPAHEAAHTGSSLSPQIKNAVGSFFSTRWDALKGGAKDLGLTALDTAKEYATVEKSHGSPSIWGIIKGTSKAVWDTLSWKSDRGLLNFKGTSLNPLSKEKSFSLNPMVAIRKIAAGTTLAISKVMGGTIGLASDRLGNATEGGINAVSRAVGGVVAGDFGGYMGNTPAANHSAPHH